MIRVKGQLQNLHTFVLERSVFFNLKKPHQSLEHKLSTALKGHVGRPLRVSKLMRKRSRASNMPMYFRRLTSTTFCARLPALATGLKPTYNGQRFSVNYRTASGVSFYMDMFNPKLFTFNLYNLHRFFPKMHSVHTSFIIGFLHVNVRLRYIRDILDYYPRYSRSAGSDSLVIAKDPFQSRLIITLPSGRKKFFFILAQAILVYRDAETSFSYSAFSARKTRQTAGYWRNQGWRPTVRGVAMNPVDHPHGGRTKTVRLPLTPWGLVTKKKH